MHAHPRQAVLFALHLQDQVRHTAREARGGADLVPRAVHVADGHRGEPLAHVLPAHPERAVVAGVPADGLLRLRRPLLRVVAPVAVPLLVVAPRVPDHAQLVALPLLHRNEGVGVPAGKADVRVLLPHVRRVLVLRAARVVRRVLPGRAQHLDVVLRVVVQQVLEQRRLHVLGVEHPVRTPRQVRQRLPAGPGADRAVRAVQLRVRLLQQRHPQLVGLLAVLREAWTAAARGEVRVEREGAPPAVLADGAAVDAQLVVLGLVEDAVHQGLELGQAREGREEVAVAEAALVDVLGLHRTHEQRLLHVRRQVLLRQLPARVLHPVRVVAHQALLGRRERQVDEPLAGLGAHLGDGLRRHLLQTLLLEQVLQLLRGLVHHLGRLLRLRLEPLRVRRPGADPARLPVPRPLRRLEQRTRGHAELVLVLGLLGRVLVHHRHLSLLERVRNLEHHVAALVVKGKRPARLARLCDLDKVGLDLCAVGTVVTTATAAAPAAAPATAPRAVRCLRQPAAAADAA
eukprot:Rhum_TRINITY_DN14511_c27_g1::Rhum_TRINITY_DN14511_c27_g1_i1::g.93882::m.93882